MPEIKCPKCGSTDMQYWSEKKGASFSKGCCGYTIFGPFGALFALCGSNKTDEYWVCKKCGEKYYPNSFSSLMNEALNGTDSDSQKAQQQRVKEERERQQKREKEEKDQYVKAVSDVNRAEKVLEEYHTQEALDSKIQELSAVKTELNTKKKNLIHQMEVNTPMLKVVRIIRNVMWVIALLALMFAFMMWTETFLGALFFLILGIVIFVVGYRIHTKYEEKSNPDLVKEKDATNEERSKIEKELNKLRDDQKVLLEMEKNRTTINLYEEKHHIKQ